MQNCGYNTQEREKVEKTKRRSTARTERESKRRKKEQADLLACILQMTQGKQEQHFGEKEVEKGKSKELKSELDAEKRGIPWSITSLTQSSKT